MTLHGKNIVAGALSPEGINTFRAVDPSVGRELEPVFHDAREDEINRAVDNAALAFQERQPRDADQTAGLLERIAEEIEALGDELIDRAGLETGLPAGRLQMERGRTVNQLRLFANVAREDSWVDARIDTADASRKPLPKPDLRRMLIPMGPVAVFGASNFPLAFSVAGGDTASALAAGNPVIVKAHPAHPGTSELVGGAIGRALSSAGFSDDWVSMLHGHQPEVGLVLVRHPAVRAVGFTGSFAAGMAILDTARSRPEPIPVHAEMGSINPLFILPGALSQRTDQIAQGLHASVTLGVGQFCTNPGLVICLEGDDLDRLIARLAELFQANPPGTMLHQGILDAYSGMIERLAERADVQMSAHSSPPPDPSRTESPAMLFVTDAETFLGDDELSQEVFGPSTLIVRCRSDDEMAEIACNLQGQLTATLHATEEDLQRFEQLPTLLEPKVGRLVFDGFPTGVEVCPAMHHGGPYPATTDTRSTSVGTAAIARFARPICYQGWPQHRLPTELRDENVRGIRRMVDGVLTKDDVA